MIVSILFDAYISYYLYMVPYQILGFDPSLVLRLWLRPRGWCDYRGACSRRLRVGTDWPGGRTGGWSAPSGCLSAVYFGFEWICSEGKFRLIVSNVCTQVFKNYVVDENNTWMLTWMICIVDWITLGNVAPVQAHRDHRNLSGEIMFIKMYLILIVCRILLLSTSISCSAVWCGLVVFRAVENVCHYLHGDRG